MPPALRESEHVGALARRQPAAVAADEDLDRVLAFRERDRMTISIFIRLGILRHARLVAAGQ
jgi:hypothetical protein